MAATTRSPEIFPWIRTYPIASLAAAGIATGFFLMLLSRPAAHVVFGITLAAGGAPLVFATVRNMLHGRFNVDAIASLSIVGAAALGQYEAGALVVLMQAGGEALEDYGLRRANRSLENLLRRAPSVARRKDDTGFTDVSASALKTGDTILIRQGDIIAADGVVIEGEGSVDEAALTGEPVPLRKLPGDKVYSGTINLNGRFLVRTTSTAAHSKYELIVRMVQHARGGRAPINRLANQYTPAFTMLSLAAALIAWAVSQDPVRALAVLVVATPCPLIIATPLAVLSAINSAASLNIIVKGGAAIEQAGAVDAVVFDKTGTLTVGQPVLSEIVSYESAEHPDVTAKLLRDVAAVEMFSTHVFATTVVKAARARGIPIEAASDVEEQPGTGIQGMAGGHRVCVGSRGYVKSCGVEVPDALEAEHVNLKMSGKALAYVGIDGRLAGTLIFEDQIRPESPALIHRLKGLGIARIIMLTGDAPENAQKVAQELGVPETRARLHPEQKAAVIRELMDRQTVMMVGDGINDAPALATANVGVAMGGYGAGIATDAADVVITVENVERVADTIALGRRMVRVARQGILFGIGVSTILMAFAATGWIQPAAGALLQEALDLATILNALRARGS